VPALARGGGAARHPKARRAGPLPPARLFAAAVPDPLVARLKGVDTDALTPLQALALLADLAADARSRQ
jgi:hypothetical protein